jgi:hypothetical protein
MQQNNGFDGNMAEEIIQDRPMMPANGGSQLTP